MNGYFFDIEHEWDKLKPFLSTAEFQRSVNMYHWWNFREQIGDINPLIINNESDDEKYIWSKLTEKKDPYYYCVPHDCIELNNLVMGTLAKLYTGEQMYYLSVYPGQESWDAHVVISNKKLDSGVLINLQNEKIPYTNDKLVIFDLIYPLMPFFGYSWENREEKLNILRVSHCQPLEEQWDDMGYTQYPI